MSLAVLLAVLRMTDRCTAIIDRLVEERYRKGMTQEDLAKATNYTQSVIARFENKKTVPQLDTLLKIAEALGCDLAIISENQ